MNALPARLHPAAVQNRGMSASLRRLARRRAMRVLAVGVMLTGCLHTAHGASATWTGSGADSNWSTVNNWTPGVPGTTGTTNNPDTATFNGVVTNITANLDQSYNLKNITFSGTTASAYIINATGGSQLLLTSGGTISSTAANVETINAPIVIEPGSSTTAGTYTFDSSAANAANVLKITGAITTGSTTGLITLNLTGTNTGTNTLSGTLSDTGSGGLKISKGGTGTWTYANTSTSTLTKGQLDVSGGTLNFGVSGGAAPTLNITGNTGSGSGLTSSGTSTFNMNAGTLALSGISYTINFGGSGTQTFNQTGGTITSSGFSNFSANGGTSNINISGGALTSTNSAGIELAVRGTTNAVLNGTGVITAPVLQMTNSQGTTGAAVIGNFDLGTGIGTGGTLVVGSIIHGSATPTGATTFNFNGGTLQSSASSTSFLQGLTTANVRNGGAVVNTNGFSDTIGQALLHSTVGGDNATDGGLTKQGTGTLTLSGANTYTGGTVLNQGTLTVGTGGTLGATTGALTVNNTNTGAGTAAVLNLATGVDTTVGSLSGTISTPSSGTNTVTINNGGTGRNFTVNQTAAGTYAGVLAGAGSFTLGSLSTNTLTLSGTNTYTGATAVNAGTLKAGSTQAFGVNSAVSLANVAGATLDTTGFNNSIGSLTGGGATGGNVTLGAATLTVGGDNTSPASYAGTLSGTSTSTIAKVGTGTIILGGNGTSTVGNITVNGAGGLTFGSVTESPSLTLSGTANGNGLTIDSSGSTAPGTTFTVAGGTLGLGSANGAFTENTGTYNQTGGAVTVSGSGISYLANATSSQTSVFNLSGGSFTTGSGGYFFNAVRGTATTTLSGTGVLTAPLFAMVYGAGASTSATSSTVNLGTGSAGGTLVVNAITSNVGATGATATFNFNGGTLKASAASATFMQGLTTANVQAGGAFIDTNGNTDTIGQTLVHDTTANAPAVDGGLTKNGAGTLILLGTNTYTGGTKVNTPSSSTSTLSGNAGSYGVGAVAVASGATVDYTQSGVGTAANNISGGGTATFGGVLSNGVGGTNGNGTGGTINYTGQDRASTSVQSGTLVLNHGGGAALTGPVAIATATSGPLKGTLQLGADNQIQTNANNATPSAVALSGGTFNAAGNSDGSVNDPTNLATTNVTSSMGALTLTGASVFDFGTGNAGSIVAFANSSATLGNGTLNIIDYTGGTDALYIGTSASLGTTQLAQIKFGTIGAQQLGNGEIVPAPEPSTWASFGIGLLGLGGLALRARKRALAA